MIDVSLRANHCGVCAASCALRMISIQLLRHFVNCVIAGINVAFSDALLLFTQYNIFDLSAIVRTS